MVWVVPIARATFDRCGVVLGGSATWGLLTIDNGQLSIVRGRQSGNYRPNELSGGQLNAARSPSRLVAARYEPLDLGREGHGVVAEVMRVAPRAEAKLGAVPGPARRNSPVGADGSNREA